MENKLILPEGDNLEEYLNYLLTQQETEINELYDNYYR